MKKEKTLFQIINVNDISLFFGTIKPNPKTVEKQKKDKSNTKTMPSNHF